MKISFSLRWLFPAAIMLLIVHSQSSALAGDYSGAILNGINSGLDTYQMLLQEQIRMDQQKELMQYQHELEMQRLRREEQLRRESLEREKQNRAAAETDQKQKAEEELRNSVFTGSGFFVDSTGYLITNAHVVNDKTYIAIRDSKRKFYRATVISQDKKNDLALLRVDGRFPALRIVHSDQAEKGQRVLTVGYPQISIQGNESKVTDGIINSFSGFQDDDNWFQISVPIQGGNSGGPLVNENGDVIGVVVASLNVQKFFSITGNMPQNVNYAIKSKILMQFLSSQQVRNTTQTKGKTSIDSVDRATVLVIAKNTPIDVTYEEKPVDKKAEDEKLTQRHPNWRSLIKTDGFKKWLEDTPSLKDSFASQRANDRAKALDAYNQYIVDQQEFARRAAVEEEKRRKEREALGELARRNDEVVKSYPDWQELKKNPEFIEWLAQQPESTRQMVESLNATDIISVIKQFKALPVKTLVEVGRVKSIFKEYGYIVIALNNRGQQHIKNVVLLSDGRKIKGTAEKHVGENISVTINSADISGVRNEDAVFVYQ